MNLLREARENVRSMLFDFLATTIGYEFLLREAITDITDDNPSKLNCEFTLNKGRKERWKTTFQKQIFSLTSIASG